MQNAGSTATDRYPEVGTGRTTAGGGALWWHGLIGAALWLLASLPAVAAPQIILPRTGITADEVAVLVNENDPLSRQTAEYYVKVRGIPQANVIRLHLPPGQAMIPAEAFGEIKRQVDSATPAHVQAYAVAWTEPYRVDCMSLTSALAFGYDKRFCSTACGQTAQSPYFDSPSHYPVADHGLRPAMMLAGRDFAGVKALIDRGVAADASFPKGRAYLINTPDHARSVRAAHFEETRRALEGIFPVTVLDTEAISGRNDVLFYFTGLQRVPHLETLGFLPGALADHLTSFGGRLTDADQMSILSWLEAGATASYGTVVEPCNHQQKFPLPAVAMLHYASGATAIEAYWKSVAWPGEGVFVGEPLARPFAPTVREIAPGRFELRIFALRSGVVRLARAASPMGPYQIFGPAIALRPGANRLQLPIGSASGYVQLLFGG